MQPLVLHPLSLTTTQFGQPRFSSGPECRLLNRSWSTNARGRSPRAPLTSQSMSDPPTEEPSVTSGEFNPVECPPTSSSAVETGGEPTTATTTTTTSLSHPYGNTALSQLPAGLNEPPPATLSLRYGEQTTQMFVGSPRLPPAAPQYPLPELDPSLPIPSSRSLTQKSTRRTKAHVASACVNCKKKHLGCDPARPCRRCVLSGKASSCVDVTHKKRGRPPLKADDSSLRSYITHVDSPTVPAESQPSTTYRTSLHRTTSSRELRPMTDLHAAGDPGGPSGTRVPQGQLRHRWSASVFPLTRPMDYSQHIPAQTPVDRRPYTSSGPPTYPPLAPPPPAFIPMTNEYNTSLKTGIIPPGMERRYAPYPTSALPLPTSPPHMPMGVTYLPYETPSNPNIHHPLHDPRFSGPRDSYVESPVRLPPIHQATASTGPPGLPGQVSSSHEPPSHHHTHRLSDPYPANWTTFGREHGPRHHRSASILQRSSPSVFSHSGHQRSLSTTDPALLDPVPRHLGPIDLSPAITQGHSPTVMTRAAPDDPESEESRPVKRRKMALDDMVNG